MVEDSSILSSKDFLLVGVSLKEVRQGISSSISFTLLIIDAKVVSRELLNPANLTGAQALWIPEPSEVIKIGTHENFVLAASR